MRDAERLQSRPVIGRMVVVFAMLALFLSRSADAQPGGATCETAATVGPGTYSGTVTETYDATGCSRGGFPAWYAITPTEAGTLRLETCNSAARVTLTLVSACGVVASCQVTSCGNGERVERSVVVGTTYLVRVTAPIPGAAYSLTVSLLPSRPSNDNCATPTLITLGSTPGTTVAATPSIGLYFEPSERSDVWYILYPPFSGLLTLDTCAGPELDTWLSVHDSCADHRAVAVSRDSCGLRSKLVVSVEANVWRLIRVSSPWAAGQGDFVLTASLEHAEPPPNDNPDGAIPLAAGVPMVGSTHGAGAFGSIACGTADGSPDVWYTLSQGAPSRYPRVTACGQGGFVPVVMIYDQGPTFHYPGVCAVDPCDPGTPLHSAEVGLVHIRVSGEHGSSGEFVLTADHAEFPCNADFNADGSVDQDDIQCWLYECWQFTGVDGDLNRDGNVDVDDLSALVHTIAGGGCP